MKDLWGDHPIDYACWAGAPLEIIQMILDTHKVHFADYQLDFTDLVLKADRPEIQRLLLDTHGQYFSDQDVNWEELILCIKFSSPETLKFVVRSSLRNRLENLGLEQWRNNVLNEIECIHSMSEETGLQTQLDLVQSKLERYELMEVLSILELIVWKIKIDDELKAKGEHDEFTLSYELRGKCRISCGAEAVITNVLEFL